MGSLQIWFSVSLILTLSFFENQHFEYHDYWFQTWINVCSCIIFASQGFTIRLSRRGADRKPLATDDVTWKYIISKVIDTHHSFKKNALFIQPVQMFWTDILYSHRNMATTPRFLFLIYTRRQLIVHSMIY